MHSQRFQIAYTPQIANPPQQRAARRPVILQSDPARTDCSGKTLGTVRSASRRRYHTGSQHVSSAAKGWPSVGSPNKDYGPGTYPILRETPELMREKQEEFIRAVRFQCKIAVSAVSMRPISPHLHPCDSPKGAVSPLTLGEARDYFSTEAQLAAMPPTMGSGVVSAKNLPTSVNEKPQDGQKS
jgi:hypothetical protein